MMIYRMSIKTQSTLDDVPHTPPVDETELASFLLPVFEDSPNLYTAEFEFEEMEEAGGEGGAAWVPVTSPVQLTATQLNSGYSVEKVSNSIFKMSGKPTGLFVNQILTFLMTDLKTIKSLPMNTTEKFATVLSWTPPEPKSTIAEYKFSYTILGQTYEKTFVQEAQWRYNTGLDGFRALLSKGTL